MTTPATAPLQIALLRGINVGGHRRVSMPALRQFFCGRGDQDVRTYIQSGNVIFRAAEVSVAELEAGLAEHLGFPVGVALRRGEDWAGIVAANPYPEQAREDGTRVHLALLDAEPDAEGMASLMAVPRGPDDWTLLGRELYLHLPNGGGRTRLDHNTLERRLGVTVTLRNWKTVAALDGLLAQ